MNSQLKFYMILETKFKSRDKIPEAPLKSENSEKYSQ